jgi:transmembrane sensor
VSLADSRAIQTNVAAPDPAASLPALEAGQSAVLQEGSRQVAALAPDDLERKLAWRQGMLAFADEPLGQVLEEINRYTQVSIEVTDPTLRDLPVAGRLRIDDVDSMLQALQLMADVRVERIDERHARVRARNRH